MIIGLVGGYGFAEVDGRRGPGSAGVFPLRLGRKSVGFALFVSQLLDKFLAVLPRNLLNRQVLFALEMTWVVAHDRLPFFLRHEMDTHVKTFGQPDFVLEFVATPCFFAVGTAHHEAPMWNPDEFHPNAVRERLRNVFFTKWF